MSKFLRTLVVILFLVSPVSLAQVQLDHVTTGQNDTEPANTVTLSSFTVTNHSNRLLLVCTTLRGNALGVTATSVTFNGTGLTLIARTGGSGLNLDAALWYMLAPTVTSADIVVTETSGGDEPRWMAATAYDLWNVDQGTPLDDGDGGSNIDESATVASLSMAGLTSTTAHAALVDCMANTDNAGMSMTAETGRVSRANTVTSPGNFNDSHGSSTIMDKAVAGSPTFQWTSGSNSVWSTAGAAIRSNGTLGGGVPIGTMSSMGVGR